MKTPPGKAPHSSLKYKLEIFLAVVKIENDFFFSSILEKK